MSTDIQINNTRSPINIICIDGNIGSGKSRLLNDLREYYSNNPNIVFLKEPVDEWETITNEAGETILEKFYADQQKYSFSFQMMAYISRLAILKSEILKNPNAIFITERSLFTDKFVFAKMLFDSGKIDLINYKIYLKWFDTFSSDFPISKIIYVNTDPNVCYQRIIKRSRTGEDNIPLDYLQNCHAYHNAMLDITLDSCVCTNQLVLNGNVDIYQNKEQSNLWLEQINEFLTK
jgi:deoxyadenosine/deoxycytidine kinase